MPRNLINNNGTPFTPGDLAALRNELDSLNDEQRTEYRNQNALAIAQHDAAQFLIVSGPGTGKSHLFLEKIKHWYSRNPNAKVLVTSFVRKLVADLQSDIDSNRDLTEEQKREIIATTLHKFARSIVERNHGTGEWPFRPHFQIIGQSWKEIVWEDVLSFFLEINREIHTLKAFEKQLHDNHFEESDTWRNLKQTYFKLCQFYNAAGFSDLILRAADALHENPALNENEYFIFDEYQDFNLSEETLINETASDASGSLIVGDDEQVLYENLKSGKPTLIRTLYRNTSHVNGMLPYCGRSSFHITKSAGHFIQQQRDGDCIEKIYLPLKQTTTDPKVQLIACATPTTAVDYIKKFVLDHNDEIEERKRDLEADVKKDAFLLILTPAKEINFFGPSKEEIKNIVAEYQPETRSFSEDYYKLLSYYSLSNYPNNNFTFRKVLFYENVSVQRTHELIYLCLQDGVNLCDLNVSEIVTSKEKSNEIKIIVDGNDSVQEKIDQISSLISITDSAKLKIEFEREAINQGEVTRLETEDEEEAELEEIGVKRMGAVELMTIVGSKGLSADHVIIIGFDNVNMSWVTKNAFYVAMTRARKSLHILTALKSGGAREAHLFLDQLPVNHLEFYSYKKTNHVKRLLGGLQEFKAYLLGLNAAARRGR